MYCKSYGSIEDLYYTNYKNIAIAITDYYGKLRVCMDNNCCSSYKEYGFSSYRLLSDIEYSKKEKLENEFLDLFK